MTLNKWADSQVGTMASEWESLQQRSTLDFLPLKTEVKARIIQTMSLESRKESEKIQNALLKISDFAKILWNPQGYFDPKKAPEWALATNIRVFQRLLDIIFVDSGIVSFPRINDRYERIKRVSNGIYDAQFVSEFHNLAKAIDGIKTILQMQRDNIELRSSPISQK
jgi:hypothetical protein